MIRVLVVDDSPTARLLLVKTLESVDDIRVVGTASDGLEAVALTRDLKPDLVTMDVRMPKLDGLQATEQIMSSFPTPVVIVSSDVDAADLQITFNALRAGALEVLEKPRALDAAGFESIKTRLIDMVRAMSEVRVVRRRHSPAARPEEPNRRFHLVAIGASTGGPQLLGELVAWLPPDFPCPIVIVQHMAPGFTVGFARWLGRECKLTVKVAERSEALLPATIYLAPDRHHLRIDPRWKVMLGDDEPRGMFKPSVDVLFESISEVSFAANTIGVILTGMGSDGAEGLLKMRRAGAWTLAQDAASCIVAGMPDSARALSAVDQNVEPHHLPALLSRLAARP